MFAEAASETGRLLARAGLHVVFGAGHVGLMGVLADSVLAHGGKITGVIPEALMDRELAHTGLTKLHVVPGMHERKAMMAQLADAFVALPGGFGTFEELFEVITWAQLGLHNKPIALLNASGFYDPLTELTRHAGAQDFIRESEQNLITSVAHPAELIGWLRQQSEQATPAR